MSSLANSLRRVFCSRLPKRAWKQSNITRASFSTSKYLVNRIIDINEEYESHTKGEASESEEMPWYMREVPQVDFTQRRVEIPEVPDGAPSTLKNFLNLVSEYGMSDIKLFDLRHDIDEEIDTVHLGEFIILCTGKSEKHNFKAANELKAYVKHNHNVLTKAEGLVSFTQSPIERRRMMRRANKGPASTDNDYGKRANSWIMCDTQVDNIVVHLLTKERRAELNLDSLWLPEKEIADENSDPALHSNKDATQSVFNQAKRQLHTSGAFHQNSTKILPSTIYNDFLLSPAHQDRSSLRQVMKKLEESFSQANTKDYETKFKLYKAIHILDHSLVSFQEVRDVIFEKYGDIKIVLDENLDLYEERIYDTVEFIKLLIDSPQLSEEYQLENSSKYCDRLLEEQASFTSTLFRFSTHQLELSRNPKLIPLLMRLTYVELDSPLGSSDVNDVIYNRKLITPRQPEPTIKLASNRSRDIKDLLSIYNEKMNYSTPTSLKELQLFIYGNAGKWKEFWNYWDISFSVLGNKDPDFVLVKWVKLSVYLALRNDKGAMLKFLNQYWSKTSLSSHSFLREYEDTPKNTLSKEEIDVMKKAMSSILKSLQGKEDGNFHDVKKFIDSTDS